MAKEKVLLRASLCYPVRKREALLAPKLRKIGKGLYNGYGGGIEGDETPEECAIRELEQESGLRGNIESLRKIAVVDFHNEMEDGGEFICTVHTYIITEWKGQARASAEMGKPQWFPLDALPFDEMMLADRRWLPVALALEKPIYVRARYGPRQETLKGPVTFGVLKDK